MMINPRVLLFIVIALISCSKSQDVQPSNNAKACFTSVSVASQGTPVQFTSTCSQNASTYAWDFGDGATSTDASPSHSYAASGTFNVSLTVTATNKSTSIFKASVKITSIPTKYHMSDITADETWEAGYLHFVFGIVNVYNATVTIQPGVTVRFMSNAQLNIGPDASKSTNATLIANGTLGSPIIFTADSSTPTNGYYGGITFGPGCSALSSFTYCTVEYGGSPYSSTYNGGVRITNATVAFENNIIRHTKGAGIYTSDSSLFAKFNNNSFSDNETYALELSPNTVHTIGTGNVLGSKPIIIDAGTFKIASATWAKKDFDYLSSGFVIASTDSVNTSVLTLAPGVNLKMTGKIVIGLTTSSTVVGEPSVPIIHKGTLIAEGTSLSPITMTSSSATPAPVDWGGISFTAGNISSSLKYCVIQYGGSWGYNYNDPAMITVNTPSSVTINNCTLANAGTCAFYVASGASFGSFDNNTISTGNTADGINIPANMVHKLGLNNTITAQREIIINNSTFTLASATWPKQNYPYYVDGLINVSSQSTNGSMLTLTAGTEFRMIASNGGIVVGDESTLSFKGSLIAVGTAASPIKFTSAKAAPAAGDWGTIEFAQTSLAGSKLQYVIMEYGGSNLAELYIQKTNVPTVSNCSINNSMNWGIVTNSCTPSLTSNTFSNNASGNVNNTAF